MARGVPRKIAQRVADSNRRSAAHNSSEHSDSDDSSSADDTSFTNGDNQSGLTDLLFGELPHEQIPLVRLLSVGGAFTACLVGSLFLFLSGFLLSRVELPDVTTCNLLDQYGKHVDNGAPSHFHAPWSYLDAKEGAHLGNIEADGCWIPKRYNRTVFLIIDALRYDFTKYDETYSDDTVGVHRNSTTGEYDYTDQAFFGPFAFLNKLPFLTELLSPKSWGSSLLFRGRADPPTTTLQRIKALTTGTLPTFVDAGSNFFGQEIAEDNIVHKLNSLGRNVVFMGDDTWENTYTGRFNSSYPFPSLEVWDLHSVDNGVKKHLNPTLEGKENEGWDFLIAHFLGVDHAGHRYGPSHPEMSKKLLEMDEMLRGVVERMDDDTLLVVLGDHGMDNKGDHGGDSENELNAALFMYSKRGDLYDPKIREVGTPENKFFEEYLAFLEKESQTTYKSDDPLVYQYGDRTFPQIDIVSSLSLLTGLPIPYGNLGTVIPELFYVNDPRLPGFPSWQRLLEATRINAHQMHAYLKEYDAVTYSSLLNKRLVIDFEIAEGQYYLLDEGKKTFGHDGEDGAIMDTISNFVRFTRRALNIARRNWARFDLKLITFGIVALLLTAISIFTFVYFDAEAGRVYSIGSMVFIVLATIVGGLLLESNGDITGILSSLVSLTEFKADTLTLSDKFLLAVTEISAGEIFALDVKKLLLFLLIAGANIAYILTSWGRSFFSSGLIVRYIKSQLLPRDAENFFNPIVVIATILLAATIASDCFTVFEDKGALHITQGLTLLAIFWNYYNFSGSEEASTKKSSKTGSKKSTTSTSKKDSRSNELISREIADRDRAVGLLIAFMVLVRLISVPTVCREEQNPYCIPNFYSEANNSTSAWWTIPILGAVHIVVAFVTSKLLKRGDNRHSAGIVIARYTLPILLAIGWVYWLLDTAENNGVGGGTVSDSIIYRSGFVSLILNNLGSVKFNWARIMFPFSLLSGYCIYLQDPSTISVDVISGQTHHGLVKGGKDDGSSSAPRLHLRGIANGVPSSLLMNFSIVYALISLFQKPMGGIVLGLEYLAITILIAIPNKNLPISMRMILLLYVSKLAFFGTGHQYNLASIHWDTSNIGIRKLSMFLSPIPVILNTLGAQILSAAAFPVVITWMNRINGPTKFAKYFLIGWQLPKVLELLASISIAAMHRRHLMVWRVFAPKMIFLFLENVFTTTIFGSYSLIICSTFVAYHGRNKFLQILQKFIVAKSKQE